MDAATPMEGVAGVGSGSGGGEDLVVAATGDGAEPTVDDGAEPFASDVAETGLEVLLTLRRAIDESCGKQNWIQLDRSSWIVSASEIPSSLVRRLEIDSQ